jgi:hypothetical protein
MDAFGNPKAKFQNPEVQEFGRGGEGVDLKTLSLGRQVLYHMSHTPVFKNFYGDFIT